MTSSSPVGTAARPVLDAVDATTRMPVTGPSSPSPRISTGERRKRSSIAVRLAGRLALRRNRARSRRCVARSASASARRDAGRRPRPGSTIDVGARQLAELAQLGVGERGLRRPRRPSTIDVLDRRGAEAPRSRGRRCRSARARRARAPACARRRSPRCRCRSPPRARRRGRSRGRRSPGGRCTRRRTRWPRASRPVLARDPEPVVVARADGVDDRVVALEQLLARHVARRARRRRRSGSPAWPRSSRRRA